MLAYVKFGNVKNRNIVVMWSIKIKKKDKNWIIFKFRNLIHLNYFENNMTYIVKNVPAGNCMVNEAMVFYNFSCFTNLKTAII